MPRVLLEFLKQEHGTEPIDPALGTEEKKTGHKRLMQRIGFVPF